MFKKRPKKNLRRRLDDEIEHEEPMEVDEVTVTKEKTKKEPEAKKVVTKNTLLSFNEDLHDDEGEVFQIKKSSQSKRLMRQMDKERRKRREKGETKPPPQIKEEVVEEEVPIIKQIPLDPLIKREKTVIVGGREAEFACERSDSEDDEEENVPIFNRPKKLHHILQSGCIPDAAMIHAARKSRQKARELGDFIPVEDKNSSTETKSRLVREEEEDEYVSDDEPGEPARENKRIDFTVDTTARDLEKRREAFLASQELEGAAEQSDIEDDEVENWEAQQIRKAVSGAQLASAQQELLQQQNYLQQNQQPFSGQVYKMSPSRNEGPAIEQVLTDSLNKAAAHTPDELCRLIKERLCVLKETQRRHTVERDNLLIERDDMDNNSETIHGNRTELTKRFQFYQNLRGYVTDLVECFDEKVSDLEAFEQRFITLMAKKSNFIIQRRRQDIQDQAAEIAAKTKGVSTSMEHDENKVRRAAEREGRRSRRRKVRELNMPSADLINSMNLMPHFEGISSDDEMPELDNTTFSNEKEKIKSETNLIFEDVVDEFHDFELIMKQFEEWKRFELASYKEAYVNLSLPKIFAPLVRLSLVTWNPLEENLVDLENTRWFRQMATYSVDAQMETLSDLKSDPDFNLIPLVIEMAILPRLGRIIVEAWDPCSSSQTQRLTTTIRRILSEYPKLATRGRVPKSLLPAVLGKLKESIDNDVFIPIYPAKSASRLFFQRQFWAAFKLLKNVLAWREVIGDTRLQEICMGALLGRYLLAALRTCDPMDALEKSRYLLAALPESWLVREPQFVQLQMFSTQITSIIKSIDESSPGSREAKMEAMAILKSLGGK